MRWLVVLVAGVGLAVAVESERIALEDVPAPVREAALAAGGGQVEWIALQRQADEDVYLARVGPEGDRSLIRIGSDGARLPRDNILPPPPQPGSEHWMAPKDGGDGSAGFAHLPPEAKAAVDREAHGRAVRAVRAQPDSAGAAYEVELDDGSRLVVGGDGAVVAR
ncbi:MAG TPA: hypothetical protein VEL07_15215 [Planctomycetota bacterium]|nr:hypothetical protein [Planctomycetota bacterium]